MPEPLAAPRLVEIVFTGGSCAGKTSGLSIISRALRERGYSVLAVPEAVTMLVTAGVPNIGEVSRRRSDAICTFQRAVFGMHLSLRAQFQTLAGMFSGDGPVVLLFDRAELDDRAYHAHSCIDGFAAEHGTTLDEIRDSYDAVIHLVTAADGARDAYERQANPARWDTPEEACHFDQRIRQSWSGHRRHFVIDNSTDFVGKIDRVLETVVRIIEAAARPDSPWQAALPFDAPILSVVPDPDEVTVPV